MLFDNEIIWICWNKYSTYSRYANINIAVNQHTFGILNLLYNVDDKWSIKKPVYNDKTINYIYYDNIYSIWNIIYIEENNKIKHVIIYNDKKVLINNSSWEDLLALLDFDEFKKLERWHIIYTHWNKIIKKLDNWEYFIDCLVWSYHWINTVINGNYIQSIPNYDEEFNGLCINITNNITDSTTYHNFHIIIEIDESFISNELLHKIYSKYVDYYNICITFIANNKVVYKFRKYDWKELYLSDLHPLYYKDKNYKYFKKHIPSKFESNDNFEIWLLNNNILLYIKDNNVNKLEIPSTMIFDDYLQFYDKDWIYQLVLSGDWSLKLSDYWNLTFNKLYHFNNLLENIIKIDTVWYGKYWTIYIINNKFIAYRNDFNDKLYSILSISDNFQYITDDYYYDNNKLLCFLNK
jgi:hypothetical protein